MSDGGPRHEKQLPEYSPPKSDILSYLPASWVPFGELARIDRPTGIYLFYLPHLFGTLQAATTSTQPSKTLLYDIAYKNIILLAGTVFFRAAACAWNDNMDREYDKQVLRCRLRPLARGAVTSYQAHIFTGFLTALALAFLSLLPESCWVVSVPSICLLALYPFAKRFTDFPQAILGIQVGIGFFMGVVAIDQVSLRALMHLSGLQRNPNVHGQVAFYVANACWTIIYDTVYAQQDVEDDAKAGVRSMAVRFRGKAKALLWSVSVLEVALLTASGLWSGFGSGYMIMACGGTLASLGYMIGTINLSDPTECSWWFRNGTWFVGSSISGGLIIECLTRRANG
ncbi:UbiA prenyltransferase family-domain-containing protein [Xylariaceae sp. FL0662B]|nr:UbiA prenyltransferase family-domain-containing protein [Xylariaceae sp. FL0662B]